MSGGAFWLHGILVDDNLSFIKEMRNLGIESDICHMRNDMLSIFGKSRQDLTVMNEIENKYVYIPLHQNLTNENIEHVCSSVIKILGE